MKSAFLTEMGWSGKVPKNHDNMRTEFAWMCALDSDHINIHNYEQVKGYDVVFIIFPKATVKLNMVGVEMTTPGADKDISIYSKPIVETLKKNNTLVCSVQEGPTWLFNDYDLVTQFNFYNQLAECDIIFAHNEYDIDFYKGLFPKTKVNVIPTLMIDNVGLTSSPSEKTVIGGNFARWYGGFQSYVVATEFGCPIFVPSSHCKRNGEEEVPGLKHLPWTSWLGWMNELSTFKYAVHLMPTVAAGTFSLNCAYFGIPCIGNENVDTQRNLFPELSIDINDVYMARKLAIQLKTDHEFYEMNSRRAMRLVKESEYANVDTWKSHMEKILGFKLENSNIDNISQYEKITAVFTSCGRFDLLMKTVMSFVSFNTYPIAKYIVIDNSTLPSAREELEKIFDGLNVEIMINETNIGQVASIDKAYSTVTTPYIFHCEDDWEFFDYGFIEKSLDVLKFDDNLVNINVRVRGDGEPGAAHPVGDSKKTSSGIIYHEYLTNYLGAWHGFAWNPGLRKLSDYNLIGKSYKKYGEESGVGKVYYALGKRSACLEKFYCQHIGQNRATTGRNS